MRSQKRMAAEIMKCGLSRVRITSEKDVAEALTREDVRMLIRKGHITKVQKKGTSRAMVRQRLSQRKRGRSTGPGRRKGTAKARAPRKQEWMKTIRAVRKTLKELRDSGKLGRRDYGRLYLMAKGGQFRSRRHLLFHIRSKGLLEAPEKPKAKAKPTVKKPAEDRRLAPARKSRPGVPSKPAAKPKARAKPKPRAKAAKKTARKPAGKAKAAKGKK